MLLHWFDRRHVQLLLESQANERESLNVGQWKAQAQRRGRLFCGGHRRVLTWRSATLALV
jgi:hypothetical protein